jgi:hypothetical protein
LIVLHACWSQPTLRVWGESSRKRLGIKRRPAHRPAGSPWPHPFAADWNALHDALTSVGLRGGKASTRHDLALHLPSNTRAPQPSPPARGFESAEAGEAAGSALWTVPAEALATGDALDFLLGLPAEPPPGVALGDSLRGLAEAAKLALELVARGRVVPVLERGPLGRPVPLWRPVLTDPADEARFDALVRALPGACWAAEHRSEEDNAAGFLAALVDGCVRRAVTGARLGPARRGRRSAGDLWLKGLTERTPSFGADPAEAAALRDALAAWSRGVVPAGRGGVRTGFLLTPPDDVEAGAPEGPWRLGFFLQSVDDPSLLVPADEVWRADGSLPGLAQVPDPQERLIGDLGRAVRVFPPLEAGLRVARPTGVELDTDGAYRFLREGVPLLSQAGFSVRVPWWWHRPSAGLGVRLRARPSTSSPGGEGDGRFGMDALVAYDWQLSLGGETLSADEFRALAQRKVPLVRFRGEWVELRAAEVEAALRIFERHPAGEMTAAEVLRLAAGADETQAGLPLAGIDAEGWLGDLLAGGADERLEPLPEPPGLAGELRPYQRRGLAWLAFLDRVGAGACLADDMGLGKAQPLDARVLTPDGWRWMGDLRPGDAVIGASGKPCTVTGVYPQGEREVFRVSFSDGSATECCDEHLWQVHSAVKKRRGTAPKVLPLREIRERLRDAAGNSRHYVPMVRPVEFPDRALPLHPYLLGALLGDGGLTHSVMFSTAEPEMLERVTALLPAGTRIIHSMGVDYRISGPVRGRPNPVRTALRELGLFGCRSESKHIPEIYKLASIDDRLALLQGLLDTDGHVRPVDNNIEYLSVSRQLAEDVVFLVQSLGGRARIRCKPTTGQTAYRMSVCLPNGVAPFALRRKAEAYRGRAKYPPSRAIVDVQPVGVKPVQCIAVDAPDHLYVTDDFIVTHNTVQTLGLLLHERAAQKKRPAPTLLVCPMSVVGNWQREAARFAPELKVHVHHGAERLSGTALKKALRGVDMVVTTYALAARDRDELAAVKWGRVVLDEAQNIKNAETLQSRAVRAFPAPHRVALTGTPVENRLTELWSILDFLNPGLLGSQSAFRRRFATPIERFHDTERSAELQRLTRPFVLRRLKTDRRIIQDLPAKHEMRVFCNLTREQASLYQATVDSMLARIEESTGMERRGLVLATLTRLKQVCNHPVQLLQDGSALAGRSGKVARLEEILDEVLALGDRALVFTQFAEMGHLLRRMLEDRFGMELPFLHGGTGRAERDAMVTRFQAGEGPPVLLLSLKAGGTGLNLTAANHVIHFDRWWNPAVEDQATDRAFRIGQRRDVQVRKLVCAGTLEERIDQMIEDKKRLAETVLGTGEAWLTELSTAQLREVVALAADAVAE